MGQYYKIVNVTKKEYIEPWAFGDGAKLLEFGSSGMGAMTGLAILLANSNGRGGGDLHSENPVIGSWAGDNIVIAGDYATPGDKGEYAPHCNLYVLCLTDSFNDISQDVLEALRDDKYLAEKLKNV